MGRAVFVFLGLVFLSHFALAQPGTFKPGSEPNGFRGLKWGTHISELSDMIQVWEDGDRKYYEKKGDFLEIGGAKLHKIVYVFWQDRLYEARVAILKDYGNMNDELTNFKIVRGLCFDKFGERKRPFLGKEEYSWFGDTTWMYLGYEEPGFLRLTVGSTRILQERKVYEERMARQEALLKKKKVKEARGF